MDERSCSTCAHWGQSNFTRNTGQCMVRLPAWLKASNIRTTNWHDMCDLHKETS